jgi:trigger factor
VPVLAPVELGDYHAVQVEQPGTTVTDEDVEKVLEQVRQDQAMWLPADRPAQLGDKVTMDLKLTVGDRAVSDLHDNEFELVEERVGIFAGMDAQIVGMSEGESKQFAAQIPEDYANAELAGKEAQYDVTLKAVKYRELPELDDELAKSVGDYENMEALRTRVREQLTQQKETEARREVREKALKAVTDQAQVEVHPVLVEDEIDSMLGEQRRMLEQNRINFEQYLEMMQKSEADYRKELEPEARERAKRDLVLDAIADAEGMQASDQEIASWLELIAAMGGRRMRLNQLSRGQRANIAARIKRDKASAHVVEVATQDHTATGGATTTGETPAAAKGEKATSSGTAAARATAPAEHSEASAKTAARAAAEIAETTETTETTSAAGTTSGADAAGTTSGKATSAGAATSARAATSGTAPASEAEAAAEPSEATMTEPQAETPAPSESDV